MIKGGYKIIDFKDIPFETNGATMMVEGIHESIESNYRKPLLLSGLNIDGVEKADVFVYAVVVGGSFQFNVFGKVITIQDTDAVTITEE